MKYLFTVIAILLVIGFSLDSDAKIFMWVDEDGNKHYSNTGYQGNPQEVNEIQNNSSVQSFKTPEHQPVKPVQESAEDKENLNESIVPDDDKPKQISESIENMIDNISEAPPKSNYSNSGGSSQISTHTITKTSTQKTRIIKRNSVNINSSKAVGPSLNKFQPNSVSNQRNSNPTRIRNMRNANQSSDDRNILDRYRETREENQRRLNEYNDKIKQLEDRKDQIRIKYDQEIENQRSILTNTSQNTNNLSPTINRNKIRMKQPYDSRTSRPFNPYADIHGNHYGSYDGVNTGKHPSPYRDLYGNHYDSYNGVHTGK